MTNDAATAHDAVESFLRWLAPTVPCGVEPHADQAGVLGEVGVPVLGAAFDVGDPDRGVELRAPRLRLLHGLEVPELLVLSRVLTVRVEDGGADAFGLVAEAGRSRDPVADVGFVRDDRQLAQRRLGVPDPEREEPW
jgi:hypothetical protein